jgi:hypothetical protein
MLETFKTFKKLGDLYDRLETVEETVENYQNCDDPYEKNLMYAKVFCHVFGMAYKRTNSYDCRLLGESEKVELVIDAVNNVLEVFDVKKGYKLTTLFAHSLERQIYRVKKNNMLHKHRAHYTAKNFEKDEDWSNKPQNRYQDSGIIEIEILETLRKIEDITENDLKYCSIVMRYDRESISDSDIARIMKISPSALFQLKKRLQKKLSGTSLVTT